MPKQKYIFESINSIKDLKKQLLLEENFYYIDTSTINPNTIETSLINLNNLNQEQEKNFINFIHYADKIMNYNGQANGNRFQKIPTILSSIIYFANFYDKISNYDYEQIALLAKYSALEEYSFYEESFTIYTPTILNAITMQKTDFMNKCVICEMVMKLFEENKNEQEIIHYINNTDPKVIAQELYKYLKQELEKGGISI